MNYEFAYEGLYHTGRELQTWQAIDVTKNDPGNGVQSTDLSISLGLLFNSPENGAGRDLIIS
jgi:hypothetical protein